MVGVDASGACLECGMIHRPSLGRTCDEWRVIRAGLNGSAPCDECGAASPWHDVDCELGNTEEAGMTTAEAAKIARGWNRRYVMAVSEKNAWVDHRFPHACAGCGAPKATSGPGLHYVDCPRNEEEPGAISAPGSFP
jgi:hypothetical protein